MIELINQIEELKNYINHLHDSLYNYFTKLKYGVKKCFG